MQTSARIMALVFLVVIAFATLAPIGMRPTSALPADAERCLAYAAVGVSFALGWPRHWFAVIAAVILMAGVLETLQIVASTRHGTVLDFLVKASGGCAGVTIAQLLSASLKAEFLDPWRPGVRLKGREGEGA